MDSDGWALRFGERELSVMQLGLRVSTVFIIAASAGLGLALHTDSTERTASQVNQLNQLDAFSAFPRQNTARARSMQS